MRPLEPSKTSASRELLCTRSVSHGYLGTSKKSSIAGSRLSSARWTESCATNPTSAVYRKRQSTNWSASKQARKAESSQFEDSNLEADDALSNDEATNEPSEAPQELITEEPPDVSTPSSVPDGSQATAPKLIETGAKQESSSVKGEQSNKPAETPAGSASASVSTLANIIEKVAGLAPADERKCTLGSGKTAERTWTSFSRDAHERFEPVTQSAELFPMGRRRVASRAGSFLKCRILPPGWRAS